MAAEPRNCPQCNSDDPADLRLGDGAWTIARCQACGFVYQTSAPRYEDLSELYSWDKMYALEAMRRKKARPVFNWIDQKTRWRLHMFPRPETRVFIEKLLPGGDVIDLGCGEGGHAAALPERFTPWGVEISKTLAAAAHERFSARGGECLHAPSIEGLNSFGAGRFDGAMLNSYLEHETCPAGVLKAVRHALKPGGVAMIKVPNFASWNAAIMGRHWCGIRLPEHVNYFTPASLRRMAEACGFTVSFPHLANLPTNDNFWAFLRPA